MMQKGFSIIVLLFENITANFRAEFPNPYTYGMILIGGGNHREVLYGGNLLDQM